MPVIENAMKKKLKAGENVFSFNLVVSRYPAVTWIGKECGFDWLFIDTEHNSMDLDTVSALCLSALPIGITPIVRVPGHEHFHAARALDAGAMGVVVPHVDTQEQARQVVENCKFPPLGMRSLTAPVPQLGFEGMAAKDALPVLNDNTFIIVMVETPEAVENVESIAAVEGIDCVLIGSNDLAATMGIPGELGHDRIAEAYAKVIAACEKHGKYPGMGGIYDHALMEKYIKMGARVCQGGGDAALMISAGKERTKFLSTLKKAQR